MNDLYIGAGKGIGNQLSQQRSAAGHQSFHITGRDHGRARDLVVDWSKLRESDLQRYLSKLPRIDLLFFNQNASSLSAASFESGQYSIIDLWKQTAHWQQSHYVSCLMSFQIIHTLADRLHKDSRVCWMLSSMVIRHDDDPGHADYIANKFQNYLLMKNFSRQHPSCFMGLDPGNANGSDHGTKIKMIQDILGRPTAQINGRVFDMTGQESDLYRVFC